MSALDNIKVVLVETSHPGNIGSAARAMSTMGLNHLVLVNPKYFPSSHATALAAHASDVLERAVVVETVEDAIADCGLVLGTSGLDHNLDWQVLTAQECGEKILPIAQSQSVAIVFGRESRGLTNDELNLCHYHVRIPTCDKYFSLNLAQAVQVVCYEVFRYHQQLADDGVVLKKKKKDFELASQREVEFFYQHLEETLIEVGFHRPDKPKRLFPRLRRLFARVQLERMEIDILRGILAFLLPQKTKK